MEAAMSSPDRVSGEGSDVPIWSSDLFRSGIISNLEDRSDDSCLQPS
jgi:hypothetical protein